jgi:diadenosine tetraphosphatase ApaH/serine/threonine PP2A family protein phosphatase
MRYAIFSDVHANLEAFESVIGALEGEKVDSYICGGDIVGYGADPSSCIKLTEELTHNAICGNHDWASVDEFDISYFNPHAKAAVHWTAENINGAEKEYLKALKVLHEEEDLIVVHGSLDEPERFHYILDLYAARQNFDILQKKICFVGHSHSPVIFLKSGDEVTYTRETKVELDRETSYIVNVGSVGQPRDGDPRACYAIYDTDCGTIEIKRVSYDVKKTQNKILDAGLPPVLAERLGMGR